MPSDMPSDMPKLHLHAKTVAVVVALLGTLTLVAAPATAASPHFVGKVTTTLDSDNNLQVCWKEVKLDRNQAIDYEASANASATYRCVTPLGACANAIDPVIVTGRVTAPGTFNSGKKGQITACLTIDVPSPTESPCSGPLTLTLTDISYSNIAIEDLTTPVGPVAATPSTLSAVVFVCPF